MGYDEELMEMMKVQLPWRIINLREKHGLSQQTLARKAHLAPSTISQLERGITWNVRVKTLAKLAGFFQVTFDYMAGIDQAPLVRARVIPGRPCPICGIGPAGHASGDCMIDMHASGRSFKFIAAAYGLTVKGIELLLREEYKLRRGRAKGTGQS
jgi:DNA-binding XRE family transcriptional regulator